MKNLLLKLLFLSLFSFSCTPQFNAGGTDSTQANVVSASLESTLASTPSGNQSVTQINQLKNQGYTISYILADEQNIQSINGHNGGGYEIQGKSITIYLRNDLSEQEQAHVIAHELVHIQDDLEIDQFLLGYSYVAVAAQDFVTNHKSGGASSADSRVVRYVLGTLFCTEARAYHRNQQMANEGLPTSYFDKGSLLAQFIDQNYISKFGQSYGYSADSMLSWCLEQDTMTQVQTQLVW